MKLLLLFVFLAGGACLANASPTTDKPCDYDEYRCNNGRCIPQRYVCDGYPDCDSGEDEGWCTGSTASPTTDKPCYYDEYRCNNSRCIPQRYVCDGYPDCDSGEDEDGCTGSTGTSPPPTASYCAKPFDYIGGRCVLVDAVLESNWQEAVFTCDQFNSHLAILDSMLFYADLIHFIKDKGLDQRDYWVGASDLASEGNWTWVNGDAVTMGTPLWAIYGSGSSYEQEPTSTYAADQDCGYLDNTHFQYMDDADCLDKKASICEKSLYAAEKSKDNSVFQDKMMEILELSAKKRLAEGGSQ